MTTKPKLRTAGAKSPAVPQSKPNHLAKTKASAMVKAKPSGVTFRDHKLQIALLDEVLNERDDFPEKLEKRYATFRKANPSAPTWDDVASGEGEHRPLFEKFLLEQPITANDLAKITDLTLDGDRDLYGFVWHDLVHCTKLEDLCLGQGLVHSCSLAPLAKLPRLKQLSLCATGAHGDIDRLLDCPALAELEVVNVTDEWRDLIGRLQDKGIEIKTG